jgi:hypothetical protein
MSDSAIWQSLRELVPTIDQCAHRDVPRINELGQSLTLGCQGSEEWRMTAYSDIPLHLLTG